MVKEKRSKIEPLKVIHRSILSGQDYKTYEITEIRYRQKTSPRIIDSEGNNHFVFHGVGVYYDTPENREILDRLQELEQQRNALNKAITETIDKADGVNMRKLHERIIVGAEQR